MTSPFEPPLKGVRVVELTHTILGPSCGMILADLGAEVIKVEPVDGDRTRKLRGFGGGFFGYFNRNKKSLALDADAPEGRAVLIKLLQSADVMIENFAPGSMSKRGLGAVHLEKINPRLVYCALKGFLPGPYEKRPALDEVVQMMGGLAYMTGPTGRPLRAGLYWNASCLKEIGSPKFWPKETLEPILAQYKKDHPAPPPRPTPICKGQ